MDPFGPVSRALFECVLPTAAAEYSCALEPTGDPHALSHCTRNQPHWCQHVSTTTHTHSQREKKYRPLTLCVGIPPKRFRDVAIPFPNQIIHHQPVHRSDQHKHTRIHMRRQDPVYIQTSCHYRERVLFGDAHPSQRALLAVSLLAVLPSPGCRTTQRRRRRRRSRGCWCGFLRAPLDARIARAIIAAALHGALFFRFFLKFRDQRIWRLCCFCSPLLFRAS